MRLIVVLSNNETSCFNYTLRHIAMSSRKYGIQRRRQDGDRFSATIHAYRMSNAIASLRKTAHDMLVMIDQLLNNLTFTSNLLICWCRITDDGHIAIQIVKQTKVALIEQEIGAITIGCVHIHDRKILIKAAHRSIHPVHIVHRYGQAVHRLINVRDIIHHGKKCICCFPRIVKASS